LLSQHTTLKPLAVMEGHPFVLQKSGSALLFDSFLDTAEWNFELSLKRKCKPDSFSFTVNDKEIAGIQGIPLQVCCRLLVCFADRISLCLEGAIWEGDGPLV
jgi:hypothetical protein